MTTLTPYLLFDGKLPESNGVLQVLLWRRTDRNQGQGFSGEGSHASSSAGENPQCPAQKRQPGDFGIGLVTA